MTENLSGSRASNFEDRNSSSPAGYELKELPDSRNYVSSRFSKAALPRLELAQHNMERSYYNSLRGFFRSMPASGKCLRTWYLVGTTGNGNGAESRFTSSITQTFLTSDRAAPGW